LPSSIHCQTRPTTTSESTGGMKKTSLKKFFIRISLSQAMASMNASAF
jgi:hypothetical protein